MKTALSFDDVLLVPRMSEVESRKDVTLYSELKETFFGFNLPIISSPMDTVTGKKMINSMKDYGGVGIAHRYCSIEEQVDMITIEEPKKRQLFSFGMYPAKLASRGLGAEYPPYLEEPYTSKTTPGAAIGATGDYLERAQELVKAGCNLLCVDVAHGHHVSVRDALKTLKAQFGDDIILIAGNVATAKGFKDLSKWGADAIRVGIGGGSICSTRLQTGHGVPTLQSIIDCAESGCDAKIIADGGIRNAGDIVKSFAAGADFVMLGSMLAGTDQTPGQVFSSQDGKKYKVYRGMASVEAQVDWRGQARSLEGISTTIPYKGCVGKILQNLEQNIRSGLSYSGAEHLLDLYCKSKFIRQTQAGMNESFTHILSK